MNSTINNYKLKTGDWNQPQIISFDSLFTTYSIDNVFDKEQLTRMNPVLAKWKELASNHFSIQDLYDRPIVASYMTDTPTITRRTAHVNLNDIPDLIFKTYSPNSSSLHPMATTLRAPMASLIQQTIDEGHLDQMGVPKKGLFPLFSKEVIEGLNEKTINEAFIVCAEKIKAFNPKETRELVKNLSHQSQSLLADQCCQILMKTGLGDCTWDNMQMDKEHRILYILDTEPLDFDLFIDKFGMGFEKCAQAVDECALSSQAKNGLKWFKASSHLYNLETFENTATSYLEKID